MLHTERFPTRKIALVAMFSAVYYVLSFLPGIQVVGAGGGNVTIEIEAFMASIFGLVLGPYFGALTAFAGASLSLILPPSTPTVAAAIFLPAPVINAFTVGLVYTGKWKIAAVVLAAVITLFWFLPVSQPWNSYSYIGFLVMWDKIIALAVIVPAVLLLNRLAGNQRILEQPCAAKSNTKRDMAFILSLVASILMLLNASLIAWKNKPIGLEYTILETKFDLEFGFGQIISLTASYSYIWLLLGVGTMLLSFLLHLRPEKRLILGALILALSCLSVVIGGGFFVGLILGVLGGLFAILKSRFVLPRISNSEIVLYFLLAFIGNEADNALGAVMFATPVVYEGVFGIPPDILRGLFTIAPFFYFAIRLFQAVMTTLIATPLLRHLRSAGFWPNH